jgi:hypothetical protein
MPQHSSALVSTRQHTSAYVNIRQHTSTFLPAPSPVAVAARLSLSRSNCFCILCLSHTQTHTHTHTHKHTRTHTHTFTLVYAEELEQEDPVDSELEPIRAVKLANQVIYLSTSIYHPGFRCRQVLVKVVRRCTLHIPQRF